MGFSAAVLTVVTAVLVVVVARLLTGAQVETVTEGEEETWSQAVSSTVTVSSAGLSVWAWTEVGTVEEKGAVSWLKGAGGVFPGAWIGVSASFVFEVEA